MIAGLEKKRLELLQILEVMQRETTNALSRLDPELVVHDDQPAWCVRDVVGHLGAWNGEAARSLRSHAEGGEYHVIASEAEYDAYNNAAAEGRRSWSVKQVWAEYEASADQLKSLIATMPAEKWHVEMLYPWNERGTVRNLIEIMIQHEEEHRTIVLKSIS